MINRLPNVWDNIIKFCLYALIFLIPIWFLPWTNFQVSWNKQLIVIIFSFIAFIAWLIKSIVQGEVVYKKSYANPLLLLLLLVSVFSAWFSGARSLGFLGLTGVEVDVFINVCSFVIVFFLLANTALDKKLLALLFAISGAILLVFSFLQITQYWIFPWDFARVLTFNTIGTINGLAIFLGFVFVTILSTIYGYFLIEKNSKNWKLILSGILLLAAFLILILINFWLPFVGIALIMLCLAFLDFTTRGSNSYRYLAFLGIILTISLFIIALYLFPSIGKMNFLPSFQLPLEITPSFSASWLIAKSSFQEGVKNILVGSGPATFQYQYGTYRSTTLNSTNFWSIRFVQGSNALFTELVNRGVIGLFIWLLFLGIIIVNAGKSIMAGIQPMIGLGLIYLVLMIFLYPQNFVIYFFIFVLAGLLTSVFNQEKRVINITNNPVRTFGFSLVLMILILFSTSFLYVEGRRYIGSIYFYQSLRSFGTEGDVEKALPLVVRALDFDSRNDFYLQNLAQAYLLRLNKIVNQTIDDNVKLQDLQEQFSNNLSGAIQSAKKATEINSLDSQNWLTLGQVYESVILLVPGAAEKTVESYEKALSLEPANPAIATAVGRAHLAAGDFFGRTNDRDNLKKEYEAAVSSLNKVLELKADYLPAQLLLMQAHDNLNQPKQAIVTSNQISDLVSDDPGVFYQLGVLHYRAARLDESRRNFERAVELFSNYSNARYFLGFIYERIGQRAKAIEQFDKILELNPDNGEIKTILNNLSANRATNKVSKSPSLEEEPQPKETRDKEQVTEF